jgi:hypothetical protein
VIDKEEFKKIMALMRSINRQGSTHRDGLRIGLKAAHPVENGGVVEYFFGNDGNEPLHYDKFSKFLKELHEEVICFFYFLFKLITCPQSHGPETNVYLYLKQEKVFWKTAHNLYSLVICKSD